MVYLYYSVFSSNKNKDTQQYLKHKKKGVDYD